MADWGDDTGADAAVPEVHDVKLFGKWSSDEVQVKEISLQVSKNTGKYLIRSECMLDNDMVLPGLWYLLHPLSSIHHKHVGCQRFSMQT